MERRTDKGLDMSDQELSMNAGYWKNFLAVTKSRDPYKYRILKRMSIHGYDTYANWVRTQLGNIYWEIKENDDMTFTEFYNNHLSNVVVSKQALMNYFLKMSFRHPTQSTKYKAVKRMQRIVKEFNKYKRSKICI